jgi:hypothetical protein
LDENILLSLTLNDRLTDAELIDPVADSLEGLINCKVAHRAQLFFTQG